MTANMGGPGVAEFNWEGESGTVFQLIWQHEGPWLFGCRDHEGVWLHRVTKALPVCRTGRQAFKAALAFVEVEG